ncbi:hypothetical protein K445DRAFT_14498 [Daldinia sp. EC12]|nr:hypothetical protein K445DRAFT_14498 [Daldinia sp. EC12]
MSEAPLQGIVTVFQPAVAQLGLICKDGDDDCLTSDPLQIFSARRKLRQAIEGTLCQGPGHIFGCRCKHLERLYGTETYYCDQYFCHAYRSGFKSKEARDRHLDIHERPHKCPASNCLFSDIGFHDTTELQRHTGAVHSLGILETTHPNSDAFHIQPSSNMFDALESAIILDQQQVVREMLIRIDAAAIAKFDHCTLSCLLDHSVFGSKKHALGLAVALEAEHLPNIKLLLSRGVDILEQTSAGYKLTGNPRESLNANPLEMSGYTRALGTWSPNLLAYLVNECQIEFPEKIDRPELLFSSPRIRSFTPDEAMKRFDGMKQYIIWPQAYAKGIVLAIKEARCAVAVRICLENGGNPNATAPRRPGSRNKRNMLHFAILKGDERAAEMVKVLLKHGAEINNSDLHSKVISKKMTAIEECFGCAWEEIVRRIRAGEDLAIIPRQRKKKT